MGREARTTASFDGWSGEGKALLETDEVLFRGERRLRLRLDELAGVEAEGDRLTLHGPDGPVVLELGEAEAARWANRILHPPTLADRLGVKAGSRLAFEGAFDPAVAAALRGLGAKEVGNAGEADLVFVGALALADLEPVAGLPGRLHDGASAWIVYPKGRRELREADVLAAGRAAGLVDTRVARIDERHTGLRFSQRRR
jgi:hypothetical protein